MTEPASNGARSSPLRVLLADNSAELVELLGEVIGTEPALEYVGHVSTGAAAIQKVQGAGVDVLVLDLGLEDCHGLEVLSHLVKTVSQVKVIVHSGHASAELADHARRMGASAHIVMNGDIPALLAAIHGARSASYL